MTLSWREVYTKGNTAQAFDLGHEDKERSNIYIMEYADQQT